MKSHFKVKNYYKMTPKDREDHIRRIYDWLFDAPPDHPQIERVRFALTVALQANETKLPPQIIDSLT